MGGLSAQDRSAAVQATVNRFNALGGETSEVRMAALLEFVKSRPEFIGRGRSADGVWGIFRDGVPLMILDNREAGETPSEDDASFSSMAATVPSFPPDPNAPRR